MGETLATAAFFFCGLGAGALGFVQARHDGAVSSFRSLGGVDIGERGLVVALVRKAHGEEINERGIVPAQQQLFPEKG